MSLTLHTPSRHSARAQADEPSGHTMQGSTLMQSSLVLHAGGGAGTHVLPQPFPAASGSQFSPRSTQT